MILKAYALNNLKSIIMEIGKIFFKKSQVKKNNKKNRKSPQSKENKAILVKHN